GEFAEEPVCVSRRRPQRLEHAMLQHGGTVTHRTRRGMLSGRCQCGAVRYQVADEFIYAQICHCSKCRAAAGWAFRPCAGIERNKLTIVEGEGNLLVFGTDELNDTR